jgi:hypothetical protein
MTLVVMENTSYTCLNHVLGDFILKLDIAVCWNICLVNTGHPFVLLTWKKDWLGVYTF